jgi:hypothetical protein
MGRSAASTGSIECNAETLRDELIIYLNTAFAASRSTKGNREKLDEFERCLAKGDVRRELKALGPLTEDDFLNVDEDRLPFGMFKKKLDMNDIIKLLRGEEVNGKKILNTNFIDRNFYRDGFAVYESVRKTVKKNLSEAITKKKNLKITESALTKILTNIKRKGY